MELQIYVVSAKMLIWPAFKLCNCEQDWFVLKSKCDVKPIQFYFHPEMSGTYVPK